MLFTTVSILAFLGLLFLSLGLFVVARWIDRCVSGRALAKEQDKLILSELVSLFETHKWQDLQDVEAQITNKKDAEDECVTTDDDDDDDNDDDDNNDNKKDDSETCTNNNNNKKQYDSQCAICMLSYGAYTTTTATTNNNPHVLSLSLVCVCVCRLFPSLSPFWDG